VKFQVVPSPLGNILLAGDGQGLRSLDFELGRRGRVPIPAEWELDESFPLLRRAADQLRAYFQGRRRSFSIPLAPVGTPFQQRVWAALQRIPFGETITYGELARQAGRPRAIRAAGAANGRNPISIVIPCHRVLGKDGSLTGYGGGLAKKRALLELEGARVPGNLRPGLSRVHAGVIARAP